MTGQPPDPRPVQEEELHAYVDDRLDPERRQEVARRLAGNPALRRRVEGWQAQRDQLREALAFRNREPVPATLSLAALAEARLAAAGGVRHWSFVAGIVMALALGAGGGWLAHGPQTPSEIARLSLEAASAYRVFAKDSTHAGELPPAGRTDLAAMMAQKLGRPVTVPDLSPLGYHLLGGRVLAVMYGPAAMLVYEDGIGTRITVYIQPMRRGEQTPMRPVDAGAVDGYAWIDRQIGYGVVAEGNRDRLHAVADRVRDGAAM